MYIPALNEEKHTPLLHQCIREHPLATLVTMNASGLFASHIPTVLEDDGSEFGLLKCHIARANVQWRDFNPEVEALAIFTGPQHYISASWYPSKQEHGRDVPTWNYVAVHAYGPLRVREESDWLLAHLESLTNQQEVSSERPWKVSDAPEEYIHAQMRGIVGFELPIRRLEGKWKVSQNRSERDRKAVEQELEKLHTFDSLRMKDLVARR